MVSNFLTRICLQRWEKNNLENSECLKSPSPCSMTGKKRTARYSEASTESVEAWALSCITARASCYLNKFLHCFLLSICNISTTRKNTYDRKTTLMAVYRASMPPTFVTEVLPSRRRQTEWGNSNGGSNSLTELSTKWLCLQHMLFSSSDRARRHRQQMNGLGSRNLLRS